MGATPIWRMSISQQNKDVNDIINEWTENGGREASDKACKAIREYYKQEQQKKQLMNNMGGPAADGNPNEQFIQTAEFDIGFASPLDNIPIHKLNEVELTEVQLSQLNDEQAIQLATRMHEGKKVWESNQKFVWDFFDISFVHDGNTKGETVLTIKNSEYERKRKEQRALELEARAEERRKQQQAEQEELERIMAREREADSNKTLEQLASEIVSHIRSNATNQIVAIKLGMSVPEVNKLSQSTYNLNRVVTEKLVAQPGGYATAQQLGEYERKQAAEAAERQRQEKEYERAQALFRMAQEEQRQKQEAELKRQREEKERKEFEKSIDTLTQYILSPKIDVSSFLLYANDYSVTADDFERIKAIPSEEERRAEARRYAEEKVKEDIELRKRPYHVIHRVREQRYDNNYLPVVFKNELLDPKISTEEFLGNWADDWLRITPEVYEIKKMTDPEFQKVKAKFYTEQQIKARRERIDKEEKEEQEAKMKTKNRALKH